jgi:hypothetical protein
MLKFALQANSLKNSEYGILTNDIGIDSKQPNVENTNELKSSVKLEKLLPQILPRFEPHTPNNTGRTKPKNFRLSILPQRIIFVQAQLRAHGLNGYPQSYRTATGN